MPRWLVSLSLGRRRLKCKILVAFYNAQDFARINLMFNPGRIVMQDIVASCKARTVPPIKVTDLIGDLAGTVDAQVPCGWRDLSAKRAWNHRFHTLETSGPSLCMHRRRTDSGESVALGRSLWENIASPLRAVLAGGLNFTAHRVDAQEGRL